MPEPWEDTAPAVPSHDGAINDERTEDIRRDAGKKLMFTKEELKVMQECNRESFYYRCVPLGIIFVGATQFLTQKGILKPHPRFGALFKNLGAGLAAFILGKLSYQETCKEKLMRLPNSPLAEAIKRGKGFQLWDDVQKPEEHDSYSTSSPDTSQPIQSSEPVNKYDALRQQNRREYERNRQERFRPKDSESETISKKDDEPPKVVRKNKYGDVID